jgi:deoxyribodipyrimidine photolyase-related protein
LQPASEFTFVYATHRKNQKRSPAQDLRALRVAFRVEKKMGARLAQREVLLRKVQGPEHLIERILYIPFDHLNRERGVLKTANKQTDAVVLVESARMTSGRPWHPERLFFLIASARHFGMQLEAEGFQVRYLKAPTTIDGLKLACGEFGDLPIWAAEASSFLHQAQLKDFGVNFVPNDFFLTSRSDFALWAGAQKTFVMENFYRAQRVRLAIMVTDGKPDGGRWNFDADNRLPPPKNYSWPPYLEHERDQIDAEVAAEIKSVPNTLSPATADWQPTRTWATTRAGALAQLDYFIEHHLDGFGPYEDAVAADNWALHHSLSVGANTSMACIGSWAKIIKKQITLMPIASYYRSLATQPKRK